MRKPKLYVIMGKSATGKDTVFKRLVGSKALKLKKIIGYTTRPIRNAEKDGDEYFFVDEARKNEMERNGKVIEIRLYNTINGPWYYFTADDGQIDSSCDEDYIMIGTLAAYEKLVDYFGSDMVKPIYIEVSDSERLKRAVSREDKQKKPNFSEVCRRYLADEEDFSEAELKRLNVTNRYFNANLDKCVREITEYMSGECRTE